MADPEYDFPNKCYLGDGVYVQQGGFRGEIVLTTENGISIQNTIVMSPTELRAMHDWMHRHIYTEKPAEKTNGDQEETR